MTEDRNAKLDEIYAAGKFVVIQNHSRLMPIKRREDIRAPEKGPLEFRSGRRWISALGCAVKVAHYK